MINKEKVYDIEKLTQELTESIHEILARHLQGKPVNLGDMLSVIVWAVAPQIADFIHFLPDEESKRLAMMDIKSHFGPNLVSTVEDYLLK